MSFSDFVPSGNQAVDPQLYEVENAAIDPSGTLWEALRHAVDWHGKTLVDLGCGTGYWLPKYHDAGSVIGVEPDESLLEAAGSRPGAAEVLHGSAEHLPLAGDSMDIIHARFAYFFPSRHVDPRPGLIEAARVLRPGGSLVVIDNDGHRGEFAQLLNASAGSQIQGHDDYSSRWWARQGATTTEVMSAWQFRSRKDFAAVLHLEFGQTARAWLEAHPQATGLSYGYLLHVWQKPSTPRCPVP